MLNRVTRSFVSILNKTIFQMMNNMGGMGMDGPDVGVSTCVIFLCSSTGGGVLLKFRTSFPTKCFELHEPLLRK